jgi:hypothetical protein
LAALAGLLCLLARHLTAALLILFLLLVHREYSLPKLA